jgi:hypothetical protein
MGLWRSVLEQVTPGLRTPTLVELRTTLKDAVLGPRLLDGVGKLSSIRNDLAHPMRKVSVEEALAKLPHLLQVLEGLLYLLHFLSRYALLRIDRREDASGDLWVAPLTGHDDQHKPIRLVWPNPPPLQTVVLVSAEMHARWLVLSPMYRLGRSRAVLAYVRADEGRVEHFDVCRPDQIEFGPSDRPDWLRSRLTHTRPQRARSDLGAVGVTLAQMSETAAHDTSGPHARVPTTSLPGISLPGFVPAPAPGRSSKAWLGAALVGAMAMGAALWALNRGQAPSVTPAATALAGSESNGLPMPSAAAAEPTVKSKRTPTDHPLKVANDADASLLLKEMAQAYDRADIGAFESGFLDRLNCFYGAVPSVSTSHTEKHLLGLSKGNNWRQVLGHRLIAQRPYGDGSVQEALACIASRDTPKNGKPAGRVGVQYYGLRQTQHGWRVFAIGGPMKKGGDSACTGWLTDRFRGAAWYWPEPDDGISLSSFGTTPCGEIPRP